jgi:uncharacterized protein
MTPDERNLIMGLFDRMRGQGPIQVEREAEALINSQVRQIPDSAYMLVQSVLVQEQALNATAERANQLEARVRELETAQSRSVAPASGGFLGGLFGGGSRPQPTSSVPLTRSSTPANSPWGQPSGQSGQPQYQQPMQQPGYAPQQAAPARAGGGFMAQAMTTAAGVAGGMLVANAIGNMMGGGHNKHGSGSSETSYDQSAADAQQDTAQDQQYAQENQTYAADDNDPGVSGASDSGWGGGGSDSSDA